MQNTLRHEVFPNLGIRSPILTSSVRYTRFAFYLTNAIIFFIILATFGYVKYSKWQSQQRIAKFGLPLRTNVVVVSYANLGPPPSITGNDVVVPSANATRTITSVGVPKPVPDALAVQETSPDQTVISGITTINTNTIENIVVDTLIPQINAYVPHEVEPKFVYQPVLVYPEAARSFGYEGTTFIKALLDLDGSVMRIAVVKSSGFPILDSAAVNYIANAKFSPAEQHHKPVRVWIGQTITFQLNSGINR